MALTAAQLSEILEKFKNDINSNTMQVVKQEIGALNIPALFDEQNKKIERLTRENNELKESLSTQTRLLNVMRRENNIIFYGLKEDDQEDHRKVMDKILDLCNNVLKVNLQEMELNYVKRIGNVHNTKRPVLLSLISNFKKSMLMRSCGRLKGSGIFMAPDCDKEERERRRVLYEARQRLQKAGHTVSFRRDGLLIDGRLCGLDEVKSRCEDASEVALGQNANEANTRKSKRIASKQKVEQPTVTNIADFFRSRSGSVTSGITIPPQ